MGAENFCGHKNVNHVMTKVVQNLQYGKTVHFRQTKESNNDVTLMFYRQWGVFND